VDFDSSIKISGSGLSANRLWLNVVSSNLANANTTKTASGKPYERRTLIYESAALPTSFGDSLGEALEEDLNGVRVTEIVPDKRSFKSVYEPGHPDADADGMLQMPNINPVEEMANLVMASRAYEANLAALNTSKQLALKAIEIGR
jgi:flagellar basal-body rod protein FlgC